VSAWRVALEARGLGAVSINVRITAVRKLAVEATGTGPLAPKLASGITRVKGVASKGIRVGNWLSVKQAQTLLNTPDASTTKGLRGRANLAVLLGCGLRWSECAALTFGHVEQRDGRWCIVDLIGKHGRVRTIPAPAWTKSGNRRVDYGGGHWRGEATESHAFWVGFLLSGGWRRRLERRACCQILAESLKIAGLSNRLPAHSHCIADFHVGFRRFGGEELPPIKLLKSPSSMAAHPEAAPWRS